MAGSKAGGLKARETNLKRHGKDFYKRIGHIGGQNGHTGGFAANPALARLAGEKGGRNSHRGAGRERIENVKQAKEMYKAGIEIPEIAKKLNRAQSTIYQYLES